jgi:hypothetical protein
MSRRFRLGLVQTDAVLGDTNAKKASHSARVGGAADDPKAGYRDHRVA